MYDCFMKPQEDKLVNMTNKSSSYLILTIILGLSVLFPTWTSADPIQKNLPGESAASAPPTASMSVDDSRLLVKSIPSVDIPGTLSKWKLQDSELAALRKWSQSLVENSVRNDFISKWTVLVQQVSLRNKELKRADIISLIQMIMLAAYEQAQKEIASGATESKDRSELRKQFATQLRENLNQAHQIENLARFAKSEMTDPLTGSGLGLPTVQRMLRKCEIQEQGDGKIHCKEILVSTDYELKDYMSSTESQLKQIEDQIRSSPAGSKTSGEGGQARLYALSDIARQMHNAAISYLKK